MFLCIKVYLRVGGQSGSLSGSRDPGTIFPGECTACLRLVQCHAGLCRRRLASPPPYPSLPPARVSQSPRSSCSFNPVLSGREQAPSGDLHAEAGPNPKLSPGSCSNKEEKGKSLPAASEAAD